MKVLLASPNSISPIYNQMGRLPPLFGICPPLGIGYLGAFIKECGYEVVLYDWMASSDEEIRIDIEKENPDVLGISCFTQTRSGAINAVKIAKGINSSIFTILGGGHASAFPVKMLERYGAIDAVVVGEGERKLLSLLRFLENGQNEKDLPPGIACRIKGQIVFNENSFFMEDIGELPYPIRKLNNTPPYKPFPETYHKNSQYTIMASRGCPYKCQFCSTTLFWGKRYRMRPVSNVLDEIGEVLSIGNVEYIEFLDDAMTVNKNWIKSLCKGIVDRGYKFDWSATTRANYIDKEMCEFMRAAGCIRVLIGVESFSDRILKTIHKGITSEQAVNAIKIVKKSGLKACCLLMVGNPGETIETVNESIVNIKKSKPSSIVVNPVQVYPQTELYEIAQARGMISDEYWFVDDKKAAPVFTLEHSPEELIEFTDMLYDAYWSAHWYVALYRSLGLRKVGHAIKSFFGGK